MALKINSAFMTGLKFDLQYSLSLLYMKSFFDATYYYYDASVDIILAYHFYYYHVQLNFLCNKTIVQSFSILQLYCSSHLIIFQSSYCMNKSRQIYLLDVLISSISPFNDEIILDCFSTSSLY